MSRVLTFSRGINYSFSFPHFNYVYIQYADTHNILICILGEHIIKDKWIMKRFAGDKCDVLFRHKKHRIISNMDINYVDS